MLGFGVITLTTFILALESIKKSLYFYSFIFLFSFFVPIAGKNFNTAETAFFIISIVFFFKKLCLGKTKVLVNKPLTYFLLFFITSFVAILTTSITPFFFIRYYRLFLYLGVLYIFYSELKTFEDWRPVFNNLKAGFFVLCGILSVEWSYYYIISNPVPAAVNWKYFLLDIGLYPQTMSLLRIEMWSALGSMIGIFPIQQGLAIYLSSMFFLFVSGILDPNVHSKTKDWIGTFLSSFFLVFTLVRTSTLAVLLSLIILLMIRYKPRKFIRIIPVLGVLFIIMVLVIPSSTLDRITRVPRAIFAVAEMVILQKPLDNIEPLLRIDPSTAYRLRYDLNSLELIKKNWLLGSGNSGVKLKGNKTANPHSTLLMELQYKGFIPVVFLILFIRISFKHARHTIRSFHHSRYLLWALGLIICYTITSFGSNVLSDLRGIFPLLLAISFVEMIFGLAKKYNYKSVK